MKSYQQVRRHFFKNKAVVKAYEDLAPEFEIARILIKQRTRKGLTQTELARKIGTKQSAVARLESGTYNPTVAFLGKVAKALDTNLLVSFRE